MFFLHKPIRYLFTIGLVIMLFKANAQFYNGSKQTFGKNRPRYNHFFWTYHSTQRFDVYYYQGGEGLATYLTNFAQGEIERLESILDVKLEERIAFLVFNRLSDMRQSNIGLVSGKEEYNLGGTTQIFNNKVSLFYESEYEKFEKQINFAISELIIRQILLRGSNQSIWEPNAQSGFPKWFINGLRMYLALGWSSSQDEALYILSQRNKISRFNYLEEHDEVLAGQAFWNFFAQTYGLSSIGECLSYTSFYDNHVKAIEEVTGKSFKQVLIDFENYWLPRLASINRDTLIQIDVKSLLRVRGNKRITQLAISPDATNLAWIENSNGRKRLWVKNIASGQRKLIYSTGNKLKQLQDNTYPVFAWHPGSNAITFSVETKGEIILHIVDLITWQHATRKLSNISKILSLSYSPDAMSILFSAVVAGKTDIIRYSIAENRVESITNSLSIDKFPVYYKNNSSIAFISNDIDRYSLEFISKKNILPFDRTGESIWLAPNLKDGTSFLKLTNHDYEKINNLKWLDDKIFTFVSDASGVSQLSIGEIDSTISYIDTAIHYSYRLNSLNVKSGFPVLYNADFNFSRQLAAFYAPQGGRDVIFIKPLQFPETIIPEVHKPTWWRNDLEKGWKLVEEFEEKKLPEADSSMVQNILQSKSPLNNQNVDVFSWVFEKEKLNYNLNEQGFSVPTLKKTVDRISKIGYNITLFPNKLVNQIDFGFLNANYQPYTGAPSYFNPGLNLNFVVGAADMFEDYKLYGGLSLGSDLESTEYLLMFEYLGGLYKHQFAFHRQAYVDIQIEDQQKIRSSEFIYILRYPFSQVASIGGGVTTRFDRIIIPAVDLRTLTAGDDQRLWAGLKTDYTFDNSNSLGFNLLEGIRLKVFAESQVGIGLGKRADLFTFGADLRGYLPLWRGAILAGRFAGGTSAGGAGLVYYLGSVDSWVNFDPLTANFDQSVRVSNTEKLMFQTLATNLRGFPQNIRNGPNFALINSEVRMPLMKFITNRYIGSKTLNSLQLVGFFDAGSAWKGLTPWNGENAWEEETITNGPVTITFKTQRSPLVAGYGFGLRIQTMGYPLRFDYAWGIESGEVRPPIFYFSTSIDF